MMLSNKDRLMSQRISSKLFYACRVLGSGGGLGTSVVTATGHFMTPVKLKDKAAQMAGRNWMFTASFGVAV